MTNSIPLAEIKLSDEEIDAAVSVLRSGNLRQGKLCADFEKCFAEKVGAKFAITCSSGTAALHLAYLACVMPGDEVIVPAFTFIATASMVTLMGATPIFCDVNPYTWVIDLKSAEQKITKKTKAIAPVHIFGNACPVDEISAFATNYKLSIIWDAAQAHGTTYKERDIGQFDDSVCYSFYPSKNMFTGEGGMVTMNDPIMAEKIGYMRTHGQTGKYYHTMLGFNYRMTDVEAAIGLRQLDRLDNMLAVRRRNGVLLEDGLNQVDGITPQRMSESCKHSYHQFCILVDREAFGFDRDELANRLKEEGIATGVHYPRGLNRQPIFEKLYGQIVLPETDRICEKILALPVHHGLSEEQCYRIVDCIKRLKN